MKYSTIVFIVSAALACCCFSNVAHACPVCCAAAAGPGVGSLAFLLGDAARRRASRGSLTFAALHRAAQRQPAVTAAGVVVLRQVALHRRRRQRALSAAEEKTGVVAGEAGDQDDPSTTTEDSLPEEADPANREGDPTSALMIGTIGFYKKVISPLLPPACRFVPTCSQYGVQAIEKFGPTKGCVLIAWRLLRCSPVGGKGYDPPRWPPVPFQYSSY